jgi:hypothetical protein
VLKSRRGPKQPSKPKQVMTRGWLASTKARVRSIWDSAKQNKTVSSFLAAGTLATSIFLALDNAGKVMEAGDHILSWLVKDGQAPKVDFVQVRVADLKSKWLEQDRSEENYFLSSMMYRYGSSDLSFADHTRL